MDGNTAEAVERAKAMRLPERIEILAAALAGLPEHWGQWQWVADRRPTFGDRYIRSVYGDNGRGMGRQAIALVPADEHYFGTLADFIAAADPDTIALLLAELDRLRSRITELEKGLGSLIELCHHGDFRNDETDPTGAFDRGEAEAAKRTAEARRLLTEGVK